ncbi:MAG: hypothetical protein JW985_01570 [Alphaproteobacteria bacterium]|nr:hypothetical protein [Alphaproteobacteria bacterium]
MSLQLNFENWQEYAEMEIPVSRNRIAMKENRKCQKQEEFDFRPLTKLEMHEIKIAEVAERNCKTKKEWRDAEAEDIRHGTIGNPTEMGAEELLGRYRNKMQMVDRVKLWYSDQIAICESRIIELQEQIPILAKTTRKRAIRGAANKLNHWETRLIGLEYNLMRYEHKSRRYQGLNMKWLGIVIKIEIAAIACQIAEERRGVGNKYGFNPNAKSRETAEIMFVD